jgi:four helix bundle protein
VSANQFDKLDAYRAAIEYVGLTRTLILRLRATELPMADQLDRAVLSIPCNLAEGAGEFSPGDKRRFYRYALRSTTESIALLDVSRRIGFSDPDEHSRMRELGMRLVAMLTRLVQVASARTGAGPAGRRVTLSGTGSTITGTGPQ